MPKISRWTPSHEDSANPPWFQMCDISNIEICFTFCNAKHLAASNVVNLFVLALQARDPSVHAAILAHLNQKYGSGSAAADPSSAEKNKQVSRLTVIM